MAIPLTISCATLKIASPTRSNSLTDGFQGYVDAVGGSFGSEKIDYGMPIKLYGGTSDGPRGSAERRCSPAQCIGARKGEMFGNPDKAISARLTSSGRTLRCVCRC